MKYILIFLISSISLFSETGEWILLEKFEYPHPDSPYKELVTFRKIACADSLHCVACGDISFEYPFCRTTTDGGKTWTLSMHERPTADFKKYPPLFQDMAYPDTSLCIAVGDSGWYWRSTDKGQSFVKMRMDSIIEPPKYIERHISMYNNKIGGIIYVTERLLYLTTDGGLTWYKQDVKIHDSAEYSSFQDIFFINDSTFFILGYYLINSIGRDYILLTEDFGKTWRVSNSTPKITRTIHFFDKKEGFALATEKKDANSYGDIILYTSDSGMNWEIMLDTMTKKNMRGLHEIQFVDRQHGLALGLFNNLWRTSDGGASWIKDSTYSYPKLREDLYSIAYIHPGLFYGAGYFYGKIVKWTDPNYTSVPSEPEMNANISVYPNPASSYINIAGEPHLDKVIISDYLGRTFLEYQNKSGQSENNRIDVSGLPAGMYFVRIFSEKQVKAKKMLIGG